MKSIRFWILAVGVMIISSSAGYGMGITVEEVSVRDVLAGLALAGLLSNPDLTNSKPDDIVNKSWVIADLMMKRRRR